MTFDQLDEIQFHCEEAELARFASENGIVEVWRRQSAFIGFRSATGFRRFDFKSGDHWEAMFLPNGENTWEWRLGLDIHCDDSQLILVLPGHDIPNLAVVPGVMTGKQLSGGNGVGLSIAVKPLGRSHIGRGDPIARLAFIDSFSAVSFE
ncbi:hypothetical protein [Ancylobacter sp. FA202]|uniref:hypothetical protein n=1 Tax=Ancylobacter sp. FA202 TaxID=1111106 RepID=UPI0012DF4263|nr:hypothetical protein [Ancylobacter sp. FA202]